MSEWWTYSLEDFLLFSPRVYWRLFELHNQAVWPLQIFTLLLGAATLGWVFRPRVWSEQVISAGLAAMWLFVAWSFLWNRYSLINWAAAYTVPTFVAEALLLTWIGILRKRLHLTVSMTVRGVAGLALFLYALIFHPMLVLFAGRSLRAAEVFGAAPDPTAIATLGLAMMASSAIVTSLLIPIPIAWCIMSWATLHTMEAWQGWPLLVAAGVAIALSFWSPGEPHGSRAQ